MNNTFGLDIGKLNLFFMKPNNLTSLRRMSRVRLQYITNRYATDHDINDPQGTKVYILTRNAFTVSKVQTLIKIITSCGGNPGRNHVYRNKTLQNYRKVFTCITIRKKTNLMHHHHI